MKNVKILNNIMFLFLSFIFINYITDINVYATVNANVCYDGYLYNLYSENASNSNINYETLIDGLSEKKADLAKVRNAPDKDNPFFKYDSSYGKFDVSYVGGYGYGNIFPKCYTVTSSNTITETENNDPNYFYSTTTTSKYHTKSCGIKYRDVNFQFETTNTVDNNTGKISLTIKLEGTNLSNIINRLKVYVSYDGVHNDSSAKGQCRVNASSNTVTCNNISPYKSTKFNVGNKEQVNSAIYKVYFSIKGINETDFDEVGDKTDYIDSCGGTNGEIYLGNISTTILSETQVTVNNPALTDTKLKKLCKQVEAIKAGENLIKKYVHECYDSKIPYTQYGTLENIITSKKKLLVGWYNDVETEAGFKSKIKNNTLLCTDSRLGVNYVDKNGEIDSTSELFESKIVYEKVGTYWGMICVEDYYVDGGNPSLVKAGMGVNYSNKVGIQKTCTIFNVKQVKKLDQCHSKTTSRLEAYHSQNGTESYGGAYGGPNDNFDYCIQKCDNGKYTQNCINSCYKKVYSDERSKLLTSEMKENFDFSKKIDVVKIKTLSNISGKNEININGDTHFSDGSYVTANQVTKTETYIDINGEVRTIPPGDVKYEYHDSNGNVLSVIGAGTQCDTMNGQANSYGRLYLETTTYVYPEGCSWNAEEEYQQALQASKNELAELKKLANAKSQIETYTMNVTDSKTGYIYSVSGSSISDKNTNSNAPRLSITDISSSHNKSQTTETFQYGDQGDTIPYPSETILTTIYKIELPKAYIKKDDASVIVVGNQYTNKYYGYNSPNEKNGKNYKFSDKSKTYQPAIFTSGQNVYYTNLDSPNYNVLINSGKTREELLNKNIPFAALSIYNKEYIYELYNNKNNISISFKVGGVTDFESFDTSKLSCYYGVYLGKDDVKGLRYYYREIKLNDVFPNGRKPRWNWTGTINSDGTTTGAASKYNNYIVDPEKLTADIEQKGDSIYNNDNKEVDYEFVMTSDIINQIRNYNKSTKNGKKINYLDFSLAGRSSDNKNFSQKISEWYEGTNLYSNALNITDCNNAKNGGSSTICENYGIVGGGSR